MSIFLLSLTLLMMLVIFFDFTSFTIPNWLNAIMLGLYIPFVLTQPEGFDWQMPLLAAGVVFAVGFVIFTLGFMGGGDIKLLIASAPWVGWNQLLVEYLIWVALLGGLLSVVVWLIRKAIPWVLAKSKEEKLPRILQHGEPVPYGLAISAAFLFYLWTGEITGIAASYSL